MYRNISQYSEKISQYIAIHFSCIVTPLVVPYAIFFKDLPKFEGGGGMQERGNEDKMGGGVL